MERRQKALRAHPIEDICVSTSVSTPKLNSGIRVTIRMMCAYRVYRMQGSLAKDKLANRIELSPSQRPPAVAS
jgi:hypothetical protein